MPRRRVLTQDELASIMALPRTDEELARHWTMSDADLRLVQGRRADHNRLGFAL